MKINDQIVINELYELTEPREYRIILHRYVEKKDLATLAKLYGVTRERIRQLEVQGMKKLQQKYPTLLYEEFVRIINENLDTIPLVVKKTIYVISDEYKQNKKTLTDVYGDKNNEDKDND